VCIYTKEKHYKKKRIIKKRKKKHSVSKNVEFLSAELPKTHSFGLFFLAILPTGIGTREHFGTIFVEKNFDLKPVRKIRDSVTKTTR